MITDIAARWMCCRLRREPAQVRRVRKQTSEALCRWGLGEHADLAELVVSELATNAIRHANGVIHVCVSFACGDLRVEVHDETAGRSPTRQYAGADDESGRGLALLDGLIGLHGGSRGVAYDGIGHRKIVYVIICLAADSADPVTGASATCAPIAPRHHTRRPPGSAARPQVMASRPDRSPVTCQHMPRCPGVDADDRQAARVVASYPEQGWSLLCNGIVGFEDGGALLPDGTVIEPHLAASRSSCQWLTNQIRRPARCPVPHGRALSQGRTRLEPVL
jgi:anti-sigma regulatory factor (Ser/Thr protein kinase)